MFELMEEALHDPGVEVGKVFGVDEFTVPGVREKRKKQKTKTRKKKNRKQKNKNREYKNRKIEGHAFVSLFFFFRLCSPSRFAARVFRNKEGKHLAPTHKFFWILGGVEISNEATIPSAPVINLASNRA